MPSMNLGLPFSKCNQPHCLRFDNLMRCSACGIALYCGAEHQRADRPRHKVQCVPIKESRAKLAQEEAALRAHEGDNFTPPRPFDNAAGNFWFWSGTRPYMQARYDVATTILNIRTGEAAEAALAHFMGMLRLNRGDNQGVRAQIPALYLRLGRDQDAFDFLKWYASTSDSPTYDWRDMDRPFLNLQGADAFESMEESAKRMMNLSFPVAMTLIKIRLMLDLKMLQAAVEKMAGGMSAGEKMEWVKEEAISDVLLSRPDIIERDDYKELVTDLEDQVRKMYVVVKEKNRHFWPALLDPTEFAYAVPSLYTWGSKEEAVLAFRESWYSWSETEPAIRFIREIIRGDMATSRN